MSNTSIDSSLDARIEKHRKDYKVNLRSFRLTIILGTILTVAMIMAQEAGNIPGKNGYHNYMIIALLTLLGVHYYYRTEIAKIHLAYLER